MPKKEEPYVEPFIGPEITWDYKDIKKMLDELGEKETIEGLRNDKEELMGDKRIMEMIRETRKYFKNKKLKGE